MAFYDDAVVAKGIVTADTPVDNLGDLIVPVPRRFCRKGTTHSRCCGVTWSSSLTGERGCGRQWAQYLTSDPATTVDYFEKLALPPTNEAALQSDMVKNDTYMSAWADKVTATARMNPFWPYVESARMESILTERAQAYLWAARPMPRRLEKAAEQIGELPK